MHIPAYQMDDQFYAIPEINGIHTVLLHESRNLFLWVEDTAIKMFPSNTSS